LACVHLSGCDSAGLLLVFVQTKLVCKANR